MNGTALLLAGLAGGCQVIAGVTGQDVPLPVDGGVGAAPTCSDGKKNGSESDVDCGGGKCVPCDDGKRCVVGADCKDKVCTEGACAAPACNDKVENGQETDIDCGGPKCPKCMAGQRCKAGSDCVSGTCMAAMVCAASCTDQVKDGDESDTDCGGSCPGCANGQTCGKNSDCESGVCKGGICVDFVAWTAHMGGMGGMDAATLAGLGVDGTGNAVLAANFSGKASFGGAVYDTGSISSQGFAFTRYDPMGNHIWDAGYVSGSTLDSQSVHLLAVSASGSFRALGDYQSQGIQFGNMVTLPGVSPAPIAVFMVDFNASSVATSAQKYGNQSGLNSLAFGGIATNAMGSGIVAVGAGNFGTYDVTTADMAGVTVHSGDMFVVNIASNWGLTFHDGGFSDGFAGVAIDPMGDIIAAGHHNGTLNFGGGPVNSASAGQGFVAKFTAPGAYAWSASFGAAPDGLAVDVNGDVVLCGEFSGSIDFGLGPLDSTGMSIFVTKLDHTGAAVWDKAFAVSGGMSAATTLVTTDAMGNVILAANAPGAMIDFGGGSLSASFLVAKLDASGSHVWSNAFGAGKLDRVVGVATYDDGEILIGGDFQGTLDIGSTMLSSVGADDIFLAKLRLP